jgi:yeast amino acid transporter
VLAYVAFAGCLFVLIVANGASLWNGFHQLPFLSSYLIVSNTVPSNCSHSMNANGYSSFQVLVFFALWILLKLIRSAKWSFVDLSNPQRVAKKLRDLHDIRLGAT